jgi:MFS family permease
MVAAVACGYTFDLFGRKLLIALSYALLIVMIWVLPYVPSIALLIVSKAGVRVALQYLHSHPLIIDYIKSESRGKATSLQALGNGVGELIAMSVFVSI